MTPLNGHVQVGTGACRVMLLGGWFGTADDWRALHPAIDTEAFSFVFFDYRGYGLSRSIDGEMTFDEAARDVLRLADALRWDGFSVVGHSMGAMAAQRVLLQAVDRIERLVAVSGVPASGSRMPPDRLLKFRAAVDDVVEREAIIRGSTGGRLPAAWSMNLARASSERIVPGAFARYLDEWTTKGFEDEVRGMPLPTQLIVGAHDPTLGAAAMERTWLQWYRDARMHVLPDAGHYAMLESPLSLAAAMQTFLSGAEPPKTQKG